MKKFFMLLKHDIHQTKSRFGSLGVYEKLLLAAVLLYVCYFTTTSFLLFDSLSAGVDLGSFVHAVWSFTHGRLLLSRGEFFSVLLSPLYLLWPSPKLLLFVQTLILSLGAVFVYKLSLKILNKKGVSLAFALAYLLNPGVEWSNLSDFHPLVSGTTFLLGAFYFMKQKRYGLFFVFSVLAGSTGVQAWPILGLFGVFITARALYSLRAAAYRLTARLKKEMLFGIFFALASFALFFVFSPTQDPGLFGISEFIQNRGGTSPMTEVSSVFSDSNRRAYIRQLFLPLSYLSLFSPLYLFFAFPDLFANLVSSSLEKYTIDSHYTSTITPFLFISAIFGVRLLRYFLPRLPFSFFTVLIVTSSFYSAYLYGPLPFSRVAPVGMLTGHPSALAVNSYMKTVPEDVTVSASEELIPYVSARKTIYVLPQGIQEAEYILFFINGTASPATKVNRDLSDILRNSPNYILTHERDGLIVFRKNRLSTLLY